MCWKSVEKNIYAVRLHMCGRHSQMKIKNWEMTKSRPDPGMLFLWEDVLILSQNWIALICTLRHCLRKRASKLKSAFKSRHGLREHVSKLISAHTLRHCLLKHAYKLKSALKPRHGVQELSYKLRSAYTLRQVWDTLSRKDRSLIWAHVSDFLASRSSCIHKGIPYL
jgi:hypothetical protein